MRPLLSAHGESIAYSSIPLIHTLPQADQNALRAAFAKSLSVLWKGLAFVSGLGLLVSGFMKGLPLHSMKDDSWALKEKTDQEESSSAS